MTAFDIAGVECIKMLAIEFDAILDTQILIALPDSPLLAVWGKAVDRYACWDAGIAAGAMRTIKVGAAAAEAEFGKLTVQMDINLRSGIHK